MPRIYATLGWLITLLILFQSIQEWTGAEWAKLPVVVLIFPIFALLGYCGNLTGRVFLSCGIVLTLVLMLTRADWSEPVWRALLNTGFYVSFFCAIAILRYVAQASPAMTEAGTYLARQPPGRRYLALTVGADLFSLVLNYGAIQLLGTLAVSSAKTEPDPSIREIRMRRMLLAIHRGFAATLTWSPLAISVAVAIAVFPGTSWLKMAIPGLVSSAIILMTGWALDTIFKPRPAGGARPATQMAPGRWTALLPLGFLLVTLMILMVIVEETLGIRVAGIVLVIVPMIAVIWLRLQAGSAGALGRTVVNYIRNDLAGYRNEVLLIGSAGYLGVVGAALLGPAMAASGLDLAVVPNWALLLMLVWITPVLGQIGGNPILAMSLIGPLVPSAALVGLTPTAMAVAMVCGWALTSVTSPFTASNLLIGRFGGVRALEVGWVWNRTYFFVTIALLSGWALLFGLYLG